MFESADAAPAVAAVVGGNGVELLCSRVVDEVARNANSLMCSRLRGLSKAGAVVSLSSLTACCNGEAGMPRSSEAIRKRS